MGFLARATLVRMESHRCWHLRPACGECITMSEELLKKLISINSWSIAVQLVILVTVVGGAAILTREVRGSVGGRGSMPSSATTATTKVENWQQYIRTHNAAAGSPEAMVTVLEFTDFQCPYCKNFSENERGRLLERYDGKIRFVVKNYPLEAAHPEAKMAAIAAQCGHRSGRYWELEQALFASATDLNEQSVSSMGRRLGLGAEFDTCLSERHTLEEVEQDIRDARAVGVRGTPTFVVNGQVVLGALPLEMVDSAIDSGRQL